MSSSIKHFHQHSSLNHISSKQNTYKPFMMRKWRIHCSNATTQHYQPSSWSLELMESLGTQNNHHVEIGKKGEIEEDNKLKEMEKEIRWLLENECWEASSLLQLIDDIHRLGLGYKFRQHTRKAIHSLLDSIQSNHTILNDLHDCALCFRLARQLGHTLSPDIFERFKDANGDFKENIGRDIDGMLSLYEASYLGFDGESILEEAREFSRFHLMKKTTILMPSKVSHALELPFHYRMERLEARWNIEMYEKQSNKNPILNRLAILDFNRVQSIHQRDLREVSRWWRRVGLANKLSFARDRLMESFMWAVGMVSEPQFSKCRVGLTKVVQLITLLDDIYDVYASPQDLQILTHAVQRWDVNYVDHLPDYMKVFFLALYNTVNELAYDTLKEHDQVVISQLSQGWADLCEAFMREAKWREEKHIPKFDEYLKHGWVSSSGVVLLIHAYFLLTHTVTDEAIKCLTHINDNNLMRSPSLVFRLANDLSSSQEDGERGEVAKAVSCYMHETGSVLEDARVSIGQVIDENWKEMNRQISYNCIFEERFINICCNLARVALCQYQHGDAHTTPTNLSRNRVQSIIIDPISTCYPEIIL